MMNLRKGYTQQGRIPENPRTSLWAKHTGVRALSASGSTKHQPSLRAKHIGVRACSPNGDRQSPTVKTRQLKRGFRVGMLCITTLALLPACVVGSSATTGNKLIEMAKQGQIPRGAPSCRRLPAAQMEGKLDLPPLTREMWIQQNPDEKGVFHIWMMKGAERVGRASWLLKDGNETLHIQGLYNDTVDKPIQERRVGTHLLCTAFLQAQKNWLGKLKEESGVTCTIQNLTLIPDDGEFDTYDALVTEKGPVIFYRMFGFRMESDDDKLSTMKNIDAGKMILDKEYIDKILSHYDLESGLFTGIHPGGTKVRVSEKSKPKPAKYRIPRRGHMWYGKEGATSQTLAKYRMFESLAEMREAQMDLCRQHSSAIDDLDLRR